MLRPKGRGLSYMGQNIKFFIILKCVYTILRIRIGAFFSPTDHWRASIWVCIALKISFRHPKNPPPVQRENHITRPRQNRLWADLTGFETCVSAKNGPSRPLLRPLVIIIAKISRESMYICMLETPWKFGEKIFTVGEVLAPNVLYRELRSSRYSYARSCTRTLRSKSPNFRLRRPNPTAKGGGGFLKWNTPDRFSNSFRLEAAWRCPKLCPREDRPSASR